MRNPSQVIDAATEAVLRRFRLLPVVRQLTLAVVLLGISAIPGMPDDARWGFCAVGTAVVLLMIACQFEGRVPEIVFALLFVAWFVGFQILARSEASPLAWRYIEYASVLSGIAAFVWSLPASRAPHGPDSSREPEAHR